LVVLFLPAWRASGFYLGITVAAVDRPILPWQEGYLGFDAADGIIHSAAVAGATTALRPPRLATGGTTLGVLITAASVELLIAGREGKLAAAIDAN